MTGSDRSGTDLGVSGNRLNAEVKGPVRDRVGLLTAADIVEPMGQQLATRPVRAADQRSSREVRALAGLAR